MGMSSQPVGYQDFWQWIRSKADFVVSLFKQLETDPANFLWVFVTMDETWACEWEAKLV